MGTMRVIHNAESKQAFFDWLSTRNVNKYSPSVVVSCIDRISEYVINKKIHHTDFWRIIQPGDFEQVFKKFLNAIPPNSLDTSAYKVFVDMGQLYLNFLGEKPFSNVGADADGERMQKSVTTLYEPADKQEFLQSEKQLKKQPRRDINPEALIAWLITQPNANGTLYLEHVVRQYVWALRYAPSKLILTTVDKRDVFSCQTVEELNSLWELFKSAPNYKDVNQKTSGSFSAGLSCLLRYLEHVSGRQENTPTLVKASKPISTAVKKDQVNPSMRSALYVDFNHPERCAQTRPVSCTIDGQAVIPNKLNWSQLLVAIIERFITEGNPHLAELDKMPLYGSRAFFLSRKTDIGNCTLLSNGKWIYTSYNPQTIVVIIGNLCRHCDVKFDVVSISFVPKNAPTKRSAELLSMGRTNSPNHATTGLVFEPEVLRVVSDLLSTHFPNGFRVDSPIELMRFRNYAADGSANGISLVDEDLSKAIRLCGTIFEGKVFVVGKQTGDRIDEEINTEIARGAKIMYYASFYSRHERWLFAGSVISDGMLKEILKTRYPAYQHKANYLSTKRNNGTELSTIRNEIMRVWNDDTLLNYEQISERLPYIPLDKIKHVLALNGEFIWNSTEVYTHIGIVDISDEERAVIEDYVAAACRTVGYASMSDVPLGEIKEHNHELTITAIHNAVFVMVLSGKYEKRGKIITRQGDILDALTILKDHCRSIDKCSLQDLLDFERDLTGESHRWIPMEAGYAVLVRIAEDTFVAEKYVHFDVDGIDETLDLFVTGQYLPLKSITTFAAFPHNGQAWNLFLLESYCRRFSRRYRFDSLTVNSRNAGAIVCKSCGLAYPEIMADAVAVSGVELKKTNVLEFLYNSGYIGKKNYTKTDELITQAKILRERRD